MNEEKIQNQNEQRGNNLTEMLKSMGVSENDIEEIVSSVLSDTEFQSLTGTIHTY